MKLFLPRKGLHEFAGRLCLGLLSVAAFACGDDSEGSGGSPPVAEQPVKGLSITDVDLFQAVEVPIARGMQPESSAIPIVAGKDAMLRVSFNLDDDFATRDVLVRVTLEAGEAEPTVLEETFPVSESSTRDELDSTFNILIPGASLVPEAGFRVDIIEVDSSAKHSETLGSPAFPEEGVFSLGAVDVGPGTKLFITPIRYEADGSGNLPDVSEEQIERYRSLLESMYPTPEFIIEVTDPWVYDGPPAEPFGPGWDQLLGEFTTYAHKPGSDIRAYYYGLFQPDMSFENYCAGGCILGLSFLADDPGFIEGRTSVGLGFPGDESAATMAHEVGHAHGQAHAPCGGADGADPAFPHAGGSIGVMGMDVAKLELKKADAYFDLMGYCDPSWISDYVFGNLFERTRVLKPKDNAALQEGPLRRVDSYVAAADGSLRLLRQTEMTHQPGGRTVEVLLDSGVTEGRYLPFDHLPGGVLFVEAGASAGPARRVLW